jgi:glycosyltransferase involved in cell wall biosynthesis
VADPDVDQALTRTQPAACRNPEQNSEGTAMDAPQLTLICPAHNEAGNIAQLLREWHAEFARLSHAFELIVVDDGSTDGTAQEVRRMQCELSGVRLLRHATRRGQSAALATGFAHAAGEILVTCDADLQNDPADVPRMLDRLAEADVVCGWRRDRQDTWARRLVSRGANRVLRRLFGHQLHDSGCALRVFHRSVVDRILMFHGLHRFFSLLALIEGLSVVEVPVNHRARVHGASKYGLFNRLFRTLRDLYGLQWYRSRRIARVDLLAYEEPIPEVAADSPGAHDNAAWPATIPMRQPVPSGWPVRKSA